MKSRLFRLGAAAALVVAGLGSAGNAAAQTRVVEDDDWCYRYRNSNRDHERFCEVREMTLAADRSVIAVDGRANGGIKVEGWDRNEILLRAKVQGHADSESDARSLVEEVEISTGSTITADGPRTGRHESWSVIYELMVPRESNLELETVNGGISIAEVSGEIEFRATNGGISLDGLGGDVRGRTTNGGLHIELTGDAWDGRGLDVQTTNGGISVRVPDDYSAILESGTVNGSFRIDFPITVQGRLDRRRITAELGDGGRTIRVVTTNGGVEIRRS